MFYSLSLSDHSEKAQPLPIYALCSKLSGCVLSERLTLPMEHRRHAPRQAVVQPVADAIANQANGSDHQSPQGWETAIYGFGFGHVKT